MQNEPIKEWHDEAQNGDLCYVKLDNERVSPKSEKYVINYSLVYIDLFFGNYRKYKSYKEWFIKFYILLEVIKRKVIII